MIFDIDRIGTRTARLRQRIGALLLGAAALAPSAAGAETLMDAVNAAYGSNPVLAEQRYQQKSTNENYVQARAQYGPTLSANIQATRDYTNPAIRQVSKTGAGYLQLNQQIYTGGRRRGQLEQEHANVKASEEQLRRVEGETVASVIGAYAAVLRDQRRLEVAQENVDVLQQQLKERRVRRKVRDVTITDLAQSDARLAAGEAQLAQAQAQLAVSRGEYLRVVGHEAGELAPLPELPGLPGSIDEAFAVADAENANLAAARHQEEASRANIATQRGQQRPTASIQVQAVKTGDLSHINLHNYTTEVNTFVTVTQPLWQGGAIRSRIRQAEDQNNAQQAMVDQQHRQALQDVVLAWNQLSAARVGVVSGTRQVDAAQVAFAGMQREEAYGFRQTIEVLNAEQELASAQLSLLVARYTEYTSRASLLLAMGRLDARTVNSAIPARDIDAEFKKVRGRGMLPTDGLMMMIEHVGSPKLYPKRKPDLRGTKQPKPTGSMAMPPVPAKKYTDAPLRPIHDSPLVTGDDLPASVLPYELPSAETLPR
jgi:outer membrane protein/S-layer protein transport system outer membrane protein